MARNDPNVVPLRHTPDPEPVPGRDEPPPAQADAGRWPDRRTRWPLYLILTGLALSLAWSATILLGLAEFTRWLVG